MVRTTLRIASVVSWFLHGVVERATRIVKNLAHVDTAAAQVVAGGVDIVDSQDGGLNKARLGGSDPLAEDD